MSAKKILEIRDLALPESQNNKSFTVNLKLSQGELCLIHGRNGTGKSVFLRMVAGLHPIDQGEINYGNAKAPIGTRHWRQRISFLPEHFLFPPKDLIYDTARFFLLIGGIPVSQVNKTINTYFEEWALAPWLKQRASQVSSGTLQQIKIAMALLKPADLYLLDEPFQKVDSPARQHIWKQIQSSLERQSMVIVSHLANNSDFIKPNTQIEFQGT